MINLYDHQLEAIDKLETGSILCGGVGSGKSRTAVGYFYLKECGGKTNINGKGEFQKMKTPKDLYIITTAKKRDSVEWEGECAPFVITSNIDTSLNGIKLTVDSWNNISKYKSITNAFFIFDEQRLVGSGTWVKSFLHIVKKNNWILLSATPGDTWSDYIPVFIANGFYKNRTEFLQTHAVYNRFSKFPKIDRYIDTNRLYKYRERITVIMPFEKNTVSHNKILISEYNKDHYEKLITHRWNIFKDKPIKNMSELCYNLRRVVNSDESRLELLTSITSKHDKLIVFYNFDYELEILREHSKKLEIPYSEWNGHFHQSIPLTSKWIYLVQYSSGAEGWNCIDTNATVFFSQNYSYKIMIQAAGRIDRLNTEFRDLYYYHIRSNSSIDLAIAKSVKKKKDFNANRFLSQ